MLLTKEVEVKPNGKMIQYYKDKGYEVKRNESLIVNIEHLSKGSKVYVEVECDICGDKKSIAYKEYLSSIEKYGYYTCFHCNYIKQQKTMESLYGVTNASKLQELKEKQQESCMKKYGVLNPMQNEEIKKKAQLVNYKKYGVKNVTQNKEIRKKQINTLISNYGVNNPMKSDVIKNKNKRNIIDKYGVECTLQIPEAKEKMIKTWLDKYNVDHPNKSSVVRNKTKRTCLQKFGVENPLQSPEIREKITQTLYRNSSQRTSSQQVYICNLYNGVLNYPISHYNVDIYLSEDNLVVEYDGGGHLLNVVTGRETMEEYSQKQIIRDQIIKREGYKQMRIVSSKDLLPSDDILLQMLKHARRYFSEFSNHSWIEFNIDTSMIHNAEHKDGVFFDFGELRKIKKSA